MATVNQPVSESRVQECEVSARFWATKILLYAQHMRALSDRYAIFAAILSAVTGLGVWTTLAASTQWLPVLVVSLVSLAAAAVAIIPQVKGYGTCAEAATALGPRYGHVLGELKDALGMLHNNHQDGPSFASQAVKDFEEVKAAKDALKPYPDRLQAEINRIRSGQQNPAK
jgi:hypothetical protein